MWITHFHLKFPKIEGQNAFWIISFYKPRTYIIVVMNWFYWEILLFFYWHIQEIIHNDSKIKVIRILPAIHLAGWDAKD